MIFLSNNLHAEWIFVAENTGDSQGRGKGDITYIWSSYYTDENKSEDFREFKILQKHKNPMRLSSAQKKAGLKGSIYRSSIANIEVYCNQPNRIFMAKTEYYKSDMGTEIQDSWDYNQWINIPSYTPAAIAVRMVC